MLLKTLDRLERKGNTVVVVEHDEETIRRAEHIVDLGPGAGIKGGHVVAAGSVEELIHNPQSITGQYLHKPLRHPVMATRRVEHPELREVLGASLHNLKNLRVGIPLQHLVCLTGVSGSGKSSLIREVLYANLKRLLETTRSRRPLRQAEHFHGCQSIAGWHTIQRIVEVNQTPIGKTPRSCAATYVGFWDYIRRLFADTTEARMRGYEPGRFSFNVRGGRCEACNGQGVKKIEMSFLPDVSVTCEVCGGSRFNAETMTVRFKNKTIGDILSMSVDEAAVFFSAHPPIHHALQLLQDVGLGYLTLGQQSPTLSGGEAQRIKLVTELAKTKPVSQERAVGTKKKTVARVASHRHTLYVLDEPTIGLHMADVEKLIRVLHKLVAAGNTVIIIEHNLDVIAEADWIIDLGPEGGDSGGHLVAEGTPKDIIRFKMQSHTAKFLANHLKSRRD